MAPERVLWWILGAIGAGIAITLGVGAILFSGVFYDDGCPATGHAPWSCLAWTNVDRFEMQIRTEFPLGTRRVAVKDYVTKENIKFSEFENAQSGTDLILFGKYLQGTFVRSGYALDGSMTVRIEFGKDGKSRSVDVWLNRKAPEWEK